MRHKPSGLERNPKCARKLVCGYAFLGRAKQMNSREPISHCDMAGLKDRSDLDREFLAAGVAFIGADTISFAAELAGLPDHATMRADWAIGPKPRLDIGISGSFVIELRLTENRTGHCGIPLFRNSISCRWSRQV